MAKTERNAFYLDGQSVIAESDVLRFAVGRSDLELRSEVWTIFGSASKPDFYITSSIIGKDQKGSIHPTRAQFGYTRQAWPSRGPWIGQAPSSRHLEILPIPRLEHGDSLELMMLRLPGIGLRKRGQPPRRRRPLVLIEEYDAHTCVSLNLVIYEGNWRDFVASNPGEKIIGAIPNDSGRSLIVVLRRQFDPDPIAKYNRFLRALPVTPEAVELGTDLCLFATNQRQAHEVIVMTELHNISGPKSQSMPDDRHSL